VRGAIRMRRSLTLRPAAAPAAHSLLVAGHTMRIAQRSTKGIDICGEPTASYLSATDGVADRRFSSITAGVARCSAKITAMPMCRMRRASIQPRPRTRRKPTCKRSVYRPLRRGRPRCPPARRAIRSPAYVLVGSGSAPLPPVSSLPGVSATFGRLEALFLILSTAPVVPGRALGGTARYRASDKVPTVFWRSIRKAHDDGDDEDSRRPRPEPRQALKRGVSRHPHVNAAAVALLRSLSGQALETRLGRPSTYASILQVRRTAGLRPLEKKRLHGEDQAASSSSPETSLPAS